MSLNPNEPNPWAAFGNAIGGEQARQFDADYELKKRQIDQTYKVNLMSARSQADVAKANARYQRDQVELAKERLAFDRDSFGQRLAFDRESLGENRRQFDLGHGLNQARLGYDLLGTAAQLRGPANYFQASEFARGVSAMPQTSTFLSALQRNGRLADFGAQGGLPDPETIGSLQAKLQGGGGGNDQNYLAQIGNVAAKGAHQLGAGALEQLSPLERNLFASGLDELGVDTSTFLDQYRRSRIGQGIGASRAA